MKINVYGINTCITFVLSKETNILTVQRAIPMYL